MNATATQPLEGSDLFAKLRANWLAGRTEWIETSEDQYRQQLETMWPARWVPGGFLAGEPAGHTADGQPVYHAFTLRTGTYEACDLTEAEFRRIVG